MEFSVVDDAVNQTDISVIEFNTLVQGYVVDEMGNPATDSFVWGQTFLSNGFAIWQRNR